MTKIINSYIDETTLDELRPAASRPTHIWSGTADVVGRTPVMATVGAAPVAIEPSDSASKSDYCLIMPVVNWPENAGDDYEKGQSTDCFLNGLCTLVAGYVGQSIFGDEDAYTDLVTGSWMTVGRQDLHFAYSRCVPYATDQGLQPWRVLEICLKTCDVVIREHLSVGQELCLRLQRTRRLEGIGLAALLAAVPEANLAEKISTELAAQRTGKAGTVKISDGVTGVSVGSIRALLNGGI